MNIGFDLDGVFIDKPPFIPKTLIDILYKKRSKNLTYRIPNRIEQVIRKLTHFPLLRPAISSNIAALKRISFKNNHKFYLVSGRFGFLKNETESILKRHKLTSSFHQQYLNEKNEQPHVFKDRMIKKLDIKRYIDDDFPLISYLAENNPGVKFFWFNLKHDKKLSNNLFAITKFSKILK